MRVWPEDSRWSEPRRRRQSEAAPSAARSFLKATRAAAGDVQDRKQVLSYAAARPSIDQPAHLGEQALTLCGFHQAMIRGGAHQGDVLVRVEFLNPQIARDLGEF